MNSPSLPHQTHAAPAKQQTVFPSRRSMYHALWSYASTCPCASSGSSPVLSQCTSASRLRWDSCFTTSPPSRTVPAGARAARPFGSPARTSTAGRLGRKCAGFRQSPAACRTGAAGGSCVRGGACVACRFPCRAKNCSTQDNRLTRPCQARRMRTSQRRRKAGMNTREREEILKVMDALANALRRSMDVEFGLLCDSALAAYDCLTTDEHDALLAEGSASSEGAEAVAPVPCVIVDKEGVILVRKGTEDEVCRGRGGQRLYTHPQPAQG